MMVENLALESLSFCGLHLFGDAAGFVSWLRQCYFFGLHLFVDVEFLLGSGIILVII